MSRKPRSQQSITAIKKQILDTALDLIIQGGFQQFSMRKLASRLGITATTIYNYYSNKDEFNIMIRMHGFELLYHELEKSYANHTDPLARLQSMIRSYFEFGIQYPDYYDIMFNPRTPKYLDYANTDLEPVARAEKEATLRNYTITEKAISALNEQHGILSSDQIGLKAIQLWCEAHGIISLYNSNLFEEINANSSGLMDSLIDGVITRIEEYGG
jgi:AcrR family transcriptional regulator